MAMLFHKAAQAIMGDLRSAVAGHVVGAAVKRIERGCARCRAYESAGMRLSAVDLVIVCVI